MDITELLSVVFGITLALTLKVNNKNRLIIMSLFQIDPMLGMGES